MVTEQPDLNYYEKWEEILPLGLFLLRSESFVLFCLPVLVLNLFSPLSF